MPRKFFLSAIICLFFAACTVETAEKEANDRPAAVIEEPLLPTGSQKYEWEIITEGDFEPAVQRAREVEAAQAAVNRYQQELARINDNVVVGDIDNRTAFSSRYSRLPVRQMEDAEKLERGALLLSFRQHLENADDDISPEESDYNELLDPATAGRSSRFDLFLSQNQKNKGGKIETQNSRRDIHRRN